MPIPAPPPVPDRGDAQASFSKRVFDWLTWFCIVAIPEINSIVINSAVGVYTEATFTPTVVGVTTAGVGTYTTQAGRYTRIGNRVFFDLVVSWTAHTGTGNMEISGLPFANNSVLRSTFSVQTNNIVLTANNTAGARVLSTESRIAIFQQPVGGGVITNVTMDTAGEIAVSGVYAV